MKHPETKFGEYRQRHRMTQKRLGDKLHISKNYVRDLECGLVQPTPAVANAAAAYFGVKVESLFPDGIRYRNNYNNAGPHREEARYLPPPEGAPAMKELDLLREAIAVYGLSIDKASTYLEVHPVTVRRWLKGENEPSEIYKKAIVIGVERMKPSMSPSSCSRTSRPASRHQRHGGAASAGDNTPDSDKLQRAGQIAHAEARQKEHEATEAQDRVEAGERRKRDLEARAEAAADLARERAKRLRKPLPWLLTKLGFYVR